MAATFIAAVGGTDDASGTTLDCSGALNVAAGDLLVAWVQHEGTTTSCAVAKNSGSPTNSFTFDAANKLEHSNTDLEGAFGYVLAAAADAAATFRFTVGAAKVFRKVIVMQFRPDGGETFIKDGNGAITEGNSSSAVNSGNFSTTGTDEIVCGGYADYSVQSTTTELINGVAATEPTGSPQGNTSAWYRILTATFTGGAASATLGSPAEWICGGIAFKSVSPPTISSLDPADNATGVSRTKSPAVTFSENVSAGSGNFYIWNTTRDFLHETIAVGSVSISSATATLDPTQDFRYGEEYAITWDAGVVVATTGGAAVAVLSDRTTWNFRALELAAQSSANPFLIGEGKIGEDEIGGTASTGITPGTALETDTAFACTLAKQKATGRADETDAAIACTLAHRVATGRANETDTCHAPLLSKARANETDAAIACTVSKRVATGRADETDAAIACTLAHRVATGRADESDAAFALTIPLAVRAALETDTAFACTVSKRVATGRADESDTAFARTLAHAIATGRANESDSCHAPLLSKARANETDAAIACTVSKRVATGRADETDAAIACTLAHRVATGRADESDAAFACTVSKRVATGRADESDTARRLFLVQMLARETDTAFALEFASAELTVTAALETDSAIARTFTKQISVARANETDAAITRTLAHAVATGRANESDAAFALDADKRAATGRANESDAAFALALSKRAATGRANETDAAIAPALAKRVATGVSLETSLALSLALHRAIATGRADESDSALPVAFQLRYGAALETDAALAPALVGGILELPNLTHVIPRVVTLHAEVIPLATEAAVLVVPAVTTLDAMVV